jgi:hypothetical protein
MNSLAVDTLIAFGDILAFPTPEFFPFGVEPRVEEAGLRLQRRRGRQIVVEEGHW